MAQENHKSSGRYTSHHEYHHKEDPKITLEDSWADSNEDDHEEANETCLMAVGSQKTLRNHRPPVDSWNANITNNVVELDSSIVNEPNTYHNKYIGEAVCLKKYCSAAVCQIVQYCSAAFYLIVTMRFTKLDYSGLASWQRFDNLPVVWLLGSDIQSAGSDTRPPMLDRSDFESWQQRIRLYCLGKENGKNILQSIDEGRFKIRKFKETLADDALGPEGDRVVKDLTPEEKERYKADIRATNILLQGLPKDIYILINHYTGAKDIWDNVKMLLEGSELTRDERESQLYDAFEYFCQNKGETIHKYYVKFTKLINDMRNIKMNMPKMQLNSKFVNNMLPEWGRFVTAVKLNRGLKTSNYDQLYAYLKQHEARANENKMMLKRYTQHAIDPLAFVSNVLLPHYLTQSSAILQFAYVSPVTYPPHFADNTHLDSGLTPTDDLIENLTKTFALLAQSYKTHIPQTNNQLRTSSNTRNQAIVQNGKNSDYFKDKMLLMQAQENGVVLDEEQLLFIAGGQDNTFDDDVDEPPVQDLALNVDQVFQANQCDAFDYDVDEAPTAQTMFMANISSADPIYDEAGPSYYSDILSEVQYHDNYIDSVGEYHEVHEMQNDVQQNYVVDSDVEYTSDSNIISYEQHNIHKRPQSPVHITADDYPLGNLKFVSKGGVDEVFGMHIPKDLITDAIRN
ncbi:hypothetical protein Tco_1201611 [Tanacetum coccineum]